MVGGFVGLTADGCRMISIMTKKYALLVSLVAIVGSAVEPSRAATSPTEAPRCTVGIRAGKLIDPERGEVLRDQMIRIAGERILAVGASRDGGLRDCARTIDLSKSTVLPGLIDTHTHVTSDPTVLRYERLGISIPRLALIGAANARRTLLAGFTTIRNLGADGYADVALRDAINAGDVPGPRMIVSGPGIGITGGHCGSNLLAPEFKQTSLGTADGPDEVRKAVRQNVRYGADVIKYCGTGGVFSKGTQPEIGRAHV